jgi:hypothetical protein
MEYFILKFIKIVDRLDFKCSALNNNNEFKNPFILGGKNNQIKGKCTLQ